MIFLSAQPDEFYFSWQLEIQILNFKEKEILKKGDEMHILIGHSQILGLNNQYNLLKKKYSHFPNVYFFFYPDKRKKKNYQSSLRPNIIHQHFSIHKSLYKETIFYHDSDILFLENFDFLPLLQDEIWYGSDTRSYLDINYISDYNLNLAKNMANVVGIEKATVEEHDEETIGAQYLLKNVPVNFWKKIEEDSETIFDLLSSYNKSIEFIETDGRFFFNESCNKIQDWCADMWVIFYNALYFKRSVKIAKLLDFCWAGTPIKTGDKYAILHYTGIDSEDEKLFKKGNFTFYPPLGIHYLEALSKDYYGCFVTSYLKEIRQDVEFNLDIEIDSAEHDEQKMKVLKKYYKDYGINVSYSSTNDKGQNEKQFLKIPCHIIFSVEQLEQIENLILEDNQSVVQYDNTLLANFVVLDLFYRCLQYDLLERLHYLLPKTDVVNVSLNKTEPLNYESISSRIYII